MNRRRLRNHLLTLLGVLVVVGLLGAHLGVNYGTWWLLGIVVVVLHLGLFGALITWVAQRVRRLRAEGREPADAEQ